MISKDWKLNGLLVIARMAHNTDLPITKIALEVGFIDSNYFSRQFRSALGESPRAFRKA